MKDYGELRDGLRACADVTRLQILDLLADGQERSVSELIAEVRQSQPLVSWHLRMLRHSGLIVTRRTGRQAMYRFHRPGWEKFRQRLDQLMEPDATVPTPPKLTTLTTSAEAGGPG